MKLFPIFIPIVLFACGVLPGFGVDQTGPVYVVSTLTDRNNPTAKVGDTTLREAVRAATATGRAASIVFSPALKGTVTLSLGPLALTTPVSILGKSARDLSIAGSGSARVFEISGGPHWFSGITVKSGKLTTVAAGSPGGAGILNHGTLVMQDCAVTGNQMVSVAGVEAKGGGIYNTGTLSLLRCTFSGNVVTGGAGVQRGSNALGGAIYNENGATVSAENSTFSGNTGTGGIASGGSSGERADGFGCAVIYSEGSVALKGCTISGNTGKAGARGASPSSGVGGIWNSGGSCSLFSTIVAGNTAAGFPAHKDLRGDFSSQGFNLVGAATGLPVGSLDPSGISAATDQKGTDLSPRNALLGALQNNGGQTDSMLPLTGSPALDNGKGAVLAVDQRSFYRVHDDPKIANMSGGDGTDIGAVEVQPAIAALPTVRFVDGAAQVQLSGLPGVKYQFQRSDDLQPPWTDIGTPLMADGAGKLIFLDPGPLPEKRFYRGIAAP